jgi:hypothetical protein
MSPTPLEEIEEIEEIVAVLQYIHHLVILTKKSDWELYCFPFDSCIGCVLQAGQAHSTNFFPQSCSPNRQSTLSFFYTHG